eukprot:scaffold41593_cov63-Phaeocystis_antarctica.AAC.1
MASARHKPNTHDAASASAADRHGGAAPHAAPHDHLSHHHARSEDARERNGGVTDPGSSSARDGASGHPPDEAAWSADALEGREEGHEGDLRVRAQHEKPRALAGLAPVVHGAAAERGARTAARGGSERLGQAQDRARAESAQHAREARRGRAAQVRCCCTAPACSGWWAEHGWAIA